MMSETAVVLATVVGAALIAGWLDVRFPASAPEAKIARLAHLLAALALVQSAPALMDLVPRSESHSAAAAAALLGVFLPAMAYLFVNAIWFMKLAQRALFRTG